MKKTINIGFLLIPAILLLFGFPMTTTCEAADLPEKYLENGKLKHELVYSHVQLGGFAGEISTTIRVEPDGTWSAGDIVGQSPNGKKQTNGKLTADQIATLAAALAEHDLAGLPAVINSDKPVKSPPGYSDTASTTITMKFGGKEIVANFNDGVEVNEATSRLRQRLLAIGASLRGVAKN